MCWDLIDANRLCKNSLASTHCPSSVLSQQVNTPFLSNCFWPTFNIENTITLSACITSVLLHRTRWCYEILRGQQQQQKIILCACSNWHQQLCKHHKNVGFFFSFLFFTKYLVYSVFISKYILQHWIALFWRIFLQLSQVRGKFTQKWLFCHHVIPSLYEFLSSVEH